MGIISFRLSKEEESTFNFICDEHMLNRSAIIRKALIKELCRRGFLEDEQVGVIRENVPEVSKEIDELCKALAGFSEDTES